MDNWINFDFQDKTTWPNLNQVVVICRKSGALNISYLYESIWGTNKYRFSCDNGGLSIMDVLKWKYFLDLPEESLHYYKKINSKNGG